MPICTHSHLRPFPLAPNPASAQPRLRPFPLAPIPTCLKWDLQATLGRPLLSGISPLLLLSGMGRLPSGGSTRGRAVGMRIERHGAVRHDCRPLGEPTDVVGHWDRFERHAIVCQCRRRSRRGRSKTGQSGARCFAGRRRLSTGSRRLAAQLDAEARSGSFRTQETGRCSHCACSRCKPRRHGIQPLASCCRILASVCWKLGIACPECRFRRRCCVHPGYVV